MKFSSITIRNINQSNRLFASLVILLALMVDFNVAHMKLDSPAPRRHRNNRSVQQHLSEIDYDLTAPIDPSATMLCKESRVGLSTECYEAGQTIQVEIGGDVNHNGGHCQFSISSDGQNFAVLRTVFDDCLVASKKYDVQLPTEIKPGKYIFGWSWVNAAGNREFYMNCVDFDLKSNSNSDFKAQGLLVANMPKINSIHIPEFSQDKTHGKHFYNQTGSVIVSNPKPISEQCTNKFKKPLSPLPKPTPNKAIDGSVPDTLLEIKTRKNGIQQPLESNKIECNVGKECYNKSKEQQPPVNKDSVPPAYPIVEKKKDKTYSLFNEFIEFAHRNDIDQSFLEKADKVVQFLKSKLPQLN